MPKAGDTREPSEFEWRLGAFQSRVSSQRPWLLPACGLGLLVLLGLIVSPTFREWLGGLIVTVAVLGMMTFAAVRGARRSRRRR